MRRRMVTFPDKEFAGEKTGDKPNERDLMKLGGYGTFLFSESRTDGFYRLQTDYKPLVEYMKARSWNSNSSWDTVGWGTSYIFRRSFSRKDSAARSMVGMNRVLELGRSKLVLRGSEIGFRTEPKDTYRSGNKSP